MSNVEISAAAVMQLRDQTGAGMMDCKKALIEAQGNAEKAIEVLRQRGLKKSAEKSTRIANEGIVLTGLNGPGNFGVILEINCETDFVARTDTFIAFAKNVLTQVQNTKPASLTDLLNAQAAYEKDKTVADTAAEMTGKIGEKIAIKRFVCLETKGGVIADYIHPGNKLGVLVQLNVENYNGSQSDVSALAHDLAMQTAAMSPTYVNRTEVPPQVVEKEMEILREQSKNEGKAEKVLENIVKGRLEKYFQEVCLSEQIFVKDGSKTVKELVLELSKKINQPVAIQRFERFRLGE